MFWALLRAHFNPRLVARVKISLSQAQIKTDFCQRIQILSSYYLKLRGNQGDLKRLTNNKILREYIVTPAYSCWGQLSQFHCHSLL